MSSRSRRGAVAAVLLVAVTALTGCSKPGDLTCREYGQLDAKERSDHIRKLLRDHDLATYAMDNVRGLNARLTFFCGVSGNGGATRNLNEPLEDAYDWTSKTW